MCYLHDVLLAGEIQPKDCVLVKCESVGSVAAFQREGAHRHGENESREML